MTRSAVRFRVEAVSYFFANFFSLHSVLKVVCLFILGTEGRNSFFLSPARRIGTQFPHLSYRLTGREGKWLLLLIVYIYSSHCGNYFVGFGSFLRPTNITSRHLTGLSDITSFPQVIIYMRD
ncbi:hypothetical protein F5Y17DRAFT_61404 [Xylariaceae sp. FL0594]|nr:hypothetical protein F5Y17DRAFT_61404 [Xylariaceae sp. FL0594]